MKIALFRPFDIHKWFVVGFNAFLAGLMEASNGGGGARAGKEGSFREFINFPRTAWDWLMRHPAWAVAILFAVVVAIAVIVVLTWASSRGVFMFLDNVVRDSVEIAKPWREYQKEGNSLFVWRLLLGIAAFATFGLVITFFFVKGAALYDSGVSPVLPIGFMVGLGLLVLGLVLIWGYIVLFLKDFVAALMYRNRISVGAAWKLFLGVFRKYPFHFVGYGIIIFLLMIAFVIAVDHRRPGHLLHRLPFPGHPLHQHGRDPAGVVRVPGLQPRVPGPVRPGIRRLPAGIAGRDCGACDACGPGRLRNRVRSKTAR